MGGGERLGYHEVSQFCWVELAANNLKVRGSSLRGATTMHFRAPWARQPAAAPERTNTTRGAACASGFAE
jgi:hypothetical protein